jgi:DNA repair protein RadA/Sms
LGEVGLSGELRSVSHLTLRLREAAKLGFTRAIVPRHALRRSQTQPGQTAMADGAGAGPSDFPSEIEIIGARTVVDALDAALVK